MKLTKILIAHINGLGYFLGKSIFKALTSTAKDKAEIGRALIIGKYQTCLMKRQRTQRRFFGFFVIFYD